MNLKELSELLGLSQTTVSRALNGYPEVKEATRKKVMEVARLHNYHPNTRAKSLATGKTMSIGHIIPFSDQNEMVNCVFSDFIAGAGESYAKHGYDMRLLVVEDDKEEETYIKLKETGAVDGIMLHGPKMNDPRIPLLTELGLPFLFHGRSMDVETPYSWMDVNNKSAFKRATDFLIDLGHKRIALINGVEKMGYALRRRNGYCEALKERDIAIDPTIMFSAEMTEPYGYDCASKILSRSDAPTAIMTSSIIPALGIRRAIAEQDLLLGKDVSVICFDDVLSYLPNGDREPTFTACRSSVRAAGRRCGEMLIQLITGDAQAPLTDLWEAELVVGQSTGPSPSGAMRVIHTQ